MASHTRQPMDELTPNLQHNLAFHCAIELPRDRNYRVLVTPQSHFGPGSRWRASRETSGRCVDTMQ